MVLTPKLCEAADRVAPEVPTAMVLDVAGVTLLDVVTVKKKVPVVAGALAVNATRHRGAGADAAAAHQEDGDPAGSGGTGAAVTGRACLYAVAPDERLRWHGRESAMEDDGHRGVA